MIDTASSCPNILIAHSDPLLCVGIAAALRQQGEFQVFVDGVDAANSDGPCVDVVIADLETAVHLTDRAARPTQWPLARARILVLTHNDREADIRRAVEAGVFGYLVIGGPLSELVEGVVTVAAGVRYLSRPVAQRIADSLTRAMLTLREKDVLRLLMIGSCNKEIARQLGVEVGTVKSHVTAILSKLGATSRSHAVGIAATCGLLDERTYVRTAVPARMQAAH